MVAFLDAENGAVYLGAYDEEESRAYDLAAIKYWGTSTYANSPVTDYEKEIEIMQTVTKEEYGFITRRSSGFSRGVSMSRGVARHHYNGRWEARIGRVFGNKYPNLGTYSTQGEAARAYDIAAIEYRGIKAVTNFDLSTYIRWLKRGTNSGISYQEPKATLESQPIPTSNLYPIEHTNNNFSILSPNPLIIEDLECRSKQDVFEEKTPISPCTKSSSPTALGLLLKSSIFKEPVKKNLNTNDEDTRENDTENPPQKMNENEVGEVFYNGISHVSFRGMLPCLELDESTEMPSYNNAGQSLWNGALSMPPSH